MGGWTFVHPWLLLGLVGAGLPIVIHLIGRKRAPTVSFAAFDFLMAVNARLAKRERLRQLLLLLLRTLALIALVAAVARPMPARQAAIAPSQRQLALVIDTSGSMAYELDGKTLHERAKRKARQLLSHLEPGDGVALVLAGAELKAPFSTPSYDHAAVQRAIDSMPEPHGVADLGAAIDRALGMFGNDGAGVTLAVVGDLAKNGFEGLRPTAMDPPPEVRLVDAAERDQPGALPNLAVTRLQIEQSSDSPSERRFKILVRNYGDAPISRRAVELVVDDVVRQRGYVDVPPQGTVDKVLTQTFSEPGVFAGTIRLTAAPEQDGYGIDDAMPFVVHITSGVRVLAVDGDPRTTTYEDELFFVERALEAVPKGDPPLSLSIVSVDEMRGGGVELSGYDVVLLANVGVLPAVEVDRIREFVAAGGGLLMSLGSRVGFERANDSLGSLLPHPLRDLHRAQDADAGTPALGIADFDWDHPVLAGLGQAAEQSLRTSHTAQYFNLAVGAGIKARALLRFDNGAPALIEQRRQAKGRAMLLTTSIDIDMSDIPLRSAFPALLQRAVRYLAGAAIRPSRPEARVGGTVELPAPTGVGAIALISPSGDRIERETIVGGRQRVTFADLGEVGLHQAKVERGEEWIDAPHLSVAIGPALDESDFTIARAEHISNALGGDRNSAEVSVVVGAGADQDDPFAARGAASYLLLALCLAFFGENLLASRG